MSELPIHTLEIPNPFFEGRNRVYIIPSDPLTLIDTGVATQRAFDAIVAGFDERGLAIGDVGLIVLTHKHIDHIGNAWRIQQESGAQILIHEMETHAVSDVDPGGERYRERVKERFSEWMVPEEAWPDSSSDHRWDIESAEVEGVVDGQRIELSQGHLEVVHTPGHTMGSICLHYGRQFLSGDHVLPTISPNIGGGDLRHRGLLQHFFDSLTRTIEISERVSRVFPGHGDPFDHLEDRCNGLWEHHRGRLERVVQILEGAGRLPTYDIARQMFGNLRDIHVMLGCAEAQAHLEFLTQEGRVSEDSGKYRLS